MEILSIRNPNKKYQDFELKNVSFSLQKGTITGFMGRNGAGKTTTLKSLLNLVQNSQSSILFSTHITSDLEKCADHIVYIKNGGVIANTDMDSFGAKYKVVEMVQFPSAVLHKLIGCKKNRRTLSAFVHTKDLPDRSAIWIYSIKQQQLLFYAKGHASSCMSP